MYNGTHWSVVQFLTPDHVFLIPPVYFESLTSQHVNKRGKEGNITAARIVLAVGKGLHCSCSFAV